MITTEAALYTAVRAHDLLDDATSPLTTCGCGQDLGDVARRHCPRCGCCLN